MAYPKTGVSNRSISFTKIIYTGAYMILDAQNLHTFSPTAQSTMLPHCSKTIASGWSAVIGGVCQPVQLLAGAAGQLQ